MVRKGGFADDQRPATSDCSKNKCGPGQPPGPHCLAGYPAAHFHARGMGEWSVTAHSEECRDDALGRLSLAKRTSRINLQHYGGRRPVLPCVEDSVRRPQRPGNQFTRRSALVEEPSRQFTLENYQEPPALPQCSGRARRTSRLNAWHSALSPALHQEKTRAALCRNCGCLRFLVESAGKAGQKFT